MATMESLDKIVEWIEQNNEKISNIMMKNKRTISDLQEEVTTLRETVSDLQGIIRSRGFVMSWGRTEGIPRFYIFSEDSASAYVLRHQTSTVLEFRARGRRGLGGSDGEFEGQSMSISD